MEFAITHISTACAVLEIGSTRILTDPVFNPAGRYKIDRFGFTRATKDHDPALAIEDLGPIDILLLSHHDHRDNLDRLGKEFIISDKRPEHIISTCSAQRYHPEVTDALIPNDESRGRITVNDITISATPALHAPPPFSWFESRDHVVGWILEWPGQEHGAVYISGDTVLFDGVRDVIKEYRGKISLAILHMGGVRFWPDCWRGLWTFDSKQAAKVSKELEARTIAPIHFEGWTHFKEQDRSVYDAAFEGEGIGERVIWLKRGERTEIEV